MSDELETIVTFWSPMEANLAKGQLEAAGIRSFLSGEEAAAMTWLLTNAMGGIKLQVAARDADRAHACLAEAELATAQDLDEAAVRNEAEFTDPDQAPDSADSGDEDAGPALTVREQNAERAWRGSVLGLLFLPLQFYVFYLLVKVYLSEDELRREHRRHACFAAAINLPLMVAAGLVLRTMLSS